MVAVVVFYLIYIASVLVVARAWRRSGSPEKRKRPELAVSVVVAFRNEENLLEGLLESLEKQTYEDWELLLVDDHSTDASAELTQRFFKKSPMKARLLTSWGEGKKKAVETGIREAKGEIVLLTDGDCRVPEQWVERHAASYAENPGLQLLAGPVRFESSDSVFKQMLLVEFASLIGVSAAAIGLRRPVMANGANLSYRRSLFHELDGFEGNEHIASGDDEFMMKKVMKNYPNGIFYLKDSSAIVTTYPPGNLKAFVEQRVRWASKWKLHSWSINALASVFLFIFHLINLLWPVGLLLGSRWVQAVLLFLMVGRLGAEYCFLRRVCSFLGYRLGFGIFARTAAAYSFYVVGIAVKAFSAKYQWKGRSYKTKR